MSIPILFLHYGDAWLRGSEICLLELLRGLDRERFDPIAVCHAEPLQHALVEAGVEAHQTEFPEFMVDRGHVRLQPARYVAAWRRVRHLLGHRRPALVYCNAGLSSQLGLGLAAWLRSPRIVHLHAPFYRRMYWLWGLSSADELVFVSEATRRESLARIGAPPPSRVIHNGVDLDRFAPAPLRDAEIRRSLGIGPNELVIAQVGSLIRRKGVDVLLGAFAGLRGRRAARLLVVGEGPDRAVFEAQARRLGIADAVTFLGERAHTEQLWQHAIDVNVLASRLEALPLSLLEASACGVPSVATDVGGNAEVVAHAETGLLVPSEDEAALCVALQALADNPGRRRALGDAARARAVAQFSVVRHVREVEACIESVLERRTTRTAATSSSSR